MPPAAVHCAWVTPAVQVVPVQQAPVVQGSVGAQGTLSPA
jgi:hypothetical protein